MFKYLIGQNNIECLIFKRQLTSIIRQQVVFLMDIRYS